MAQVSDLRVVPVTVTDARIYVQRWHSHLDACIGALFASAVEHRERGLVCVALMGRPIVPSFDGARTVHGQRTIAELTRVASDGSAPHAASMAGAAVSRAALALRVPQARLLYAAWRGRDDVPRHGLASRSLGRWQTMEHA